MALWKGKNNCIKVIKCMAYAYRDLNNLRRRIFLSNNEMTANAKVWEAFTLIDVEPVSSAR